jgi:hypothetical protein
MNYTNPLVQCPRCDYGDIGCPCCDGEGLLPLYDAEDYIERERAEVDEMMLEDAEVIDLMDYMLGLREQSEVTR